MSVIALPKILIERLTEDGARALIEILDMVEGNAQKVTLEIAETRFEKRLAEFEIRIEKRLSEFKTDLIKWMIGISISQMALLLALFSAFFKR